MSTVSHFIAIICIVSLTTFSAYITLLPQFDHFVTFKCSFPSIVMCFMFYSIASFGRLNYNVRHNIVSSKFQHYLGMVYISHISASILSFIGKIVLTKISCDEIQLLIGMQLPIAFLIFSGYCYVESRKLIV